MNIYIITYIGIKLFVLLVMSLFTLRARQEARTGFDYNRRLDALRKFQRFRIQLVINLVMELIAGYLIYKAL